MIVGIEESRHGPNDAMHNPSQPFEWQSAPASKSYALSWKPCQGDSLNLPDHRYKLRCCSPILAKSDSLPHTYTQAFKVNHSASRLLILNFLIIKELQSQIKNSLLGKIGFAVVLALLITRASQSRQHDTLVRLPMDRRLKIDLGKSV
ncbi:hypothetical protein Tco_1095086, partial [Tanacetum coccineum]